MSYDPAHLDNTALYTESWVEVCLIKGNAHCGHSLNTWLSSKDFIADPILRVSGRKPGIKDEVSGSTHFQVELRSDEVIFLLLSLSFTSFHLASAHMWHHPRLEGGTRRQAFNPSLLFTQEGPTGRHSGSGTTAGRGDGRVRKWRNQQVKSWFLRAFGLHKQIKLTLLGSSWTNKQNEFILKVQGAFWLTSWPREDDGCLLERGALVQSAEECPQKIVSLDTRQIVKGKGWDLKGPKGTWTTLANWWVALLQGLASSTMRTIAYVETWRNDRSNMMRTPKGAEQKE